MRNRKHKKSFLGCVVSHKEKNQLKLERCFFFFFFSIDWAAQLHLGENIRQKMSEQDTDFGSPQRRLVTLLQATSSISDKTYNMVQTLESTTLIRDRYHQLQSIVCHRKLIRDAGWANKTCIQSDVHTHRDSHASINTPMREKHIDAMHIQTHRHTDTHTAHLSDLGCCLHNKYGKFAAETWRLTQRQGSTKLIRECVVVNGRESERGTPPGSSRKEEYARTVNLPS